MATGGVVSQYLTPYNPDLAKLVADLPLWAREYFEERAGILEYEAGYSLSLAEKLAWEETLNYLNLHPL